MKRKIAVSLPEELVDEVQRAVREGHASSVSAYVTDALRERKTKGSLQELLDELDREYGPPGPEALAWAKKVWKREESLMRERSSPSNVATRASARPSADQARTSSPRPSSRRSGVAARA